MLTVSTINLTTGNRNVGVSTKFSLAKIRDVVLLKELLPYHLVIMTLRIVITDSRCASPTNHHQRKTRIKMEMSKSLNGTIDIHCRDYVSLFIFVLLISICISLLRDLTNLFVWFQAREIRLAVPNDTLRQIFFDLELAAVSMLARRMRVSWVSSALMP